MSIRPTPSVPCGAEGPINFRPVSLTLPDTLFRCGLVRSDHGAIEKLLVYYRVGLVIDLRSLDEVERDGLPQPQCAQWQHWPLEGRPQRTHTLDCTARLYADWYLDLAVENARSIVRILTRLAAPDYPAALICCHAGKDRTGLVVTLLLDLLGCGRADIAREYELRGPDLCQNIDRFAREMQRHGMTRDEYRRRLLPSADTVAMLFQALDTDHGGTAGLLQRAGLAPGTVAALQRRLIGAPAAASS